MLVGTIELHQRVDRLGVMPHCSEAVGRDHNAVGHITGCQDDGVAIESRQPEILAAVGVGGGVFGQGTIDGSERRKAKGAERVGAAGRAVDAGECFEIHPHGIQRIGLAHLPLQGVAGVGPLHDVGQQAGRVGLERQPGVEQPDSRRVAGLAAERAQRLRHAVEPEPIVVPECGPMVDQAVEHGQQAATRVEAARRRR